MASLPSWVLDEMPWTRMNIHSLNPTSRKLLGVNRKNASLSIDYYKLPKKNHKIMLRPANPLHESLEFNSKCNNLWKKFDERISPILQRYKVGNSKTRSVRNSPQLECYKNIKYSKPLQGVRRCSNPVQATESTEEEVADLGVQCDLNSEYSEAEVKIQEAKYLHYINIS